MRINRQCFLPGCRQVRIGNLAGMKRETIDMMGREVGLSQGQPEGHALRLRGSNGRQIGTLEDCH